MPMQIETTMSRKGEDDLKSGSWFWHKWDHSVATKGQIKKWLQNASWPGANPLLNSGPMANNKLRPEDEELLTLLK